MSVKMVRLQERCDEEEGACPKISTGNKVKHCRAILFTMGFAEAHSCPGSTISTENVVREKGMSQKQQGSDARKAWGHGHA